MGGCDKGPEIPVIPNIEFEEIIFKEVENGQDSLIISLNFEDGNGDLGLNGEENDPPYHDVSYFLDDEGALLTLAHRERPEYDTLPPFEFPFTCTNWIINPTVRNVKIGDSFLPVIPTEINDTLYFQRNPGHFNILVDYFVKRNGVYEEFDWVVEFEPQCNDSFDGRFPRLNPSGENRNLEGTLRYGMTTSAFLFLFRNDTMKLKIRIRDRNLNLSNEIETPDFILRDITR